MRWFVGFGLVWRRSRERHSPEWREANRQSGDWRTRNSTPSSHINFGTQDCAEIFATPELPDQFERKLNLAGRGLCGGEKSRALNTLSTLIEDLKVVGWRGKIRAV